MLKKHQDQTTKIPKTAMTISSDNSSNSQEQPDNEPTAITPQESTVENEPDPAIETPVPDLTPDDNLITTHLLCREDEVMHVDPQETPCAWRCEFELPQNLNAENTSDFSADAILLATADKRQRTEVKLSMLSKVEKQGFPRSQRKWNQQLVEDWNCVQDSSISFGPRTNPEMPLDLSMEAVGRQ